MKVLMLSTDAHILNLHSKEYKRMEEYASLTDALHIIVCNQGVQSKSAAGNLFLYPTNSMSKWLYGFHILRTALTLRGQGITVVTAQDAFEIGLLGLVVSVILRAGFEVQIHTDLFSPYYAKESLRNKLRLAIATFVLLNANSIRVVSLRIKKSLTLRFRLKREPCIIPVRLEEGLLGHSRTSFLATEYPQFTTTLLMVTRLEREKNIPMAFDALREALTIDPKVGLIIVGDGSLKEALKEEVRQRGLAEHVIFVGRKEDVRPYFESADIYLNTSNYEGYGRVLLEAMLFGTTLVTTDVGIVGELVTEQNAYITPVQNTQIFTEAVKQALTNTVLRKQKTERARETALAYVTDQNTRRLEMIRKQWQATSR